MLTLQRCEARRRVAAAAALTLAAILLCCFTITRAQEQKPLTERGFHPGHSYAVSDIEAISMASGNMTLSVPLGALPSGRGGSPGFQLNLVYNSKLYDTHLEKLPDNNGVMETRTHLGHSEDGGWRYNGLPGGYQMRLITREDGPAKECDPRENQKNAFVWKMTMIYPDGSEHVFRPWGFSDEFTDDYFNVSANGWEFWASFSSVGGEEKVCSTDAGSRLLTTQPMLYYSTDGSYTRLVVEHDPNPNNRDGRFNAWTLYFPDGSRVVGNQPGAGEFDRNNNFVQKIRTTHNGNPAWKIADQYGRHIIIEETGNFDPAVGRIINKQDFVYVAGVGGVALKWTVKWKYIAVVKNYFAPVSAPSTEKGNKYLTRLDEEFLVVDQIIMPAEAGGLAYSFTYNTRDADGDAATPTFGWGEVSSVTLPSGARVTYDWALDGVDGTQQWGQPEAKHVMNNKPARKRLVYRQEHDRQYDRSRPASSTPCDPAAETCTTEVWTYAGGPTGVLSTVDPHIGSITGPDGGVTQELVNNIRVNPHNPFAGRSIMSVSPDGTKVERVWAQNRPASLSGLSVNPVVKTEFTSVKDAAGNYVKTAIRDYGHDENGNITELRQYDWVNYADARDPSTGQLRIPAGARLLRVTKNEYWCGPNSYWHRAAPQLLNAIKSTEVSDGATVLARTEYYYDDPLKTGNLIEQRSWDSTRGPLNAPDANGSRLDSGNSVSTKTEYDPNVLGKPLRAIDANGNRTELAYDPVFGPGGEQTTDLYPTQVTSAFGTAVQRTARKEYDFSTGLVTRTTDVDNGVSARIAYDALGRAVLVVAAEGEGETLADGTTRSLETRRQTEYFDSERRVVVRSDKDTTGDGKLVSVSHYDQLGRLRLSRRLEETDVTGAATADERVGIKVQTRYLSDGAGRAAYKLVSNPYRATTSGGAAAEAAMGWTRAKSIADRRDGEAETFAGAELPAPWGGNARSTGTVKTTFDAESATTTDQAGKLRRAIIDGLGRLSQVFEAPNAPGHNYQTSYAYDALGNLREVRQGEQVRSFVYSSLSRLTSSKIPEVADPATGLPTAVIYEYDALGNLVKKTDARGVVVTNKYDELNRPTERRHATPPGLPSTPDVTYTYDTAPMGKGRLSSVSSSVSAHRFTSYDALGRVRRSEQVTDGNVYTFGYEYNLAGGLTSQTYPSGRVVATSYDPAGRVSRVGSGGNVYASDFGYAAHGGVTGVTLGNGVRERTVYNSRFQPTEIGLRGSPGGTDLLRLGYTYETPGAAGSPPLPDNNGNVLTQTITAPGLTLLHTYDYDELNRLKAARETNETAPCRDAEGAVTDCWKQVYSYDRYGNRRLGVGTAFLSVPQNLNDPVANPQVDPLTNRLVKEQDGDVRRKEYDYDAAGNLTLDARGHTYTYDANNMQVSFNGGEGAGGASYSYDAAGRRVKKVTAQGTTLFVYDAGGVLVSEYSTEAPQPGSAGTKYLTADTLGTPRVVTDKEGKVVSRHDYQPFGEELTLGRPAEYRPDGVRQQFTGQERDRESGLDYFDARYYSSTQGRFTSIDPLAASATPGNPQSWNRYAYVLNNPLVLIDPDGQVPQLADPNKPVRVPPSVTAQLKNDRVEASLRRDGSTVTVCLPASLVNKIAAAGAEAYQRAFAITRNSEMGMRGGSINPQTGQLSSGQSNTKGQSSQTSNGYSLGGGVGKDGPSLSGQKNHNNQAGNTSEQKNEQGQSLTGNYVNPSVAASNELGNAAVSTAQDFGVEYAGVRVEIVVDGVVQEDKEAMSREFVEYVVRSRINAAIEAGSNDARRGVDGQTLPLQRRP